MKPVFLCFALILLNVRANAVESKISTLQPNRVQQKHTFSEEEAISFKVVTQNQKPGIKILGPARKKSCNNGVISNLEDQK
jgi:hypothetical protein